LNLAVVFIDIGVKRRPHRRSARSAGLLPDDRLDAACRVMSTAAPRFGSDQSPSCDATGVRLDGFSYDVWIVLRRRSA
jgi:hypothetical protein